MDDTTKIRETQDPQAVYFLEVDDNGRTICSGYRMIRHFFDPRPDDPERCRACGNHNPFISDPNRVRI